MLRSGCNRVAILASTGSARQRVIDAGAASKLVALLELQTDAGVTLCVNPVI